MAGRTGWGLVDLRPLGADREGNPGKRETVTTALGCTETDVAAIRFSSTDSIQLDAGRERVLVPLESRASVVIDGEIPIPDRGAGRIHPSHSAVLEADTGVTVLVVAVPAFSTPRTEGEPVGEADRMRRRDEEPGADSPATVDPDKVGYVVPDTSDVATSYLTGPLGCLGLKVNARRLESGQSVPYHTEGSQEELFVPVDGPAAMRVGDETVETPPGTVVRVAPETPRSAFTDGSSSTTWLMLGAPPTGGLTEWDPGATIVD